LVGRVLITTADERTWPKDKSQPVVFLGEWCRRYSRREAWQKMDVKVAPYHWSDRGKLHDDYKYLQDLYERVLVDLSEKLNRHHNTKHSLRYWRILLGPWLGSFSQVLFDRWYMLRYVIDEYDISEVNICKQSKFSVTPNDMKSFSQMYVGDSWNEAIYAQLISTFFKDRVKVIEIDCRLRNNIDFKKKKGFRTYLYTAVRGIFLVLNRLLPSDRYLFFISSYLPLVSELRLQSDLSQFPRVWRREQCPKVNASVLTRQKCFSDDVKPFSDDFSSVLWSFLPDHIPSVYLEGYQDLAQKTRSIGWPGNPNLIFTSNSYYSDDVFKFWSAEKVEQGVPLVIGQHGGGFGMSSFAFHEEHQITIADKWLSWGWNDLSRPKIKPVGKLKDTDKQIQYDPNGGALMVEMSIPRYSYHLYSSAFSRNWLDYFQDQKSFLEALPDNLRKQILLRLYPIDFGWDQKERWDDAALDICYNAGGGDIKKLINKNRIYISTYNATTYLESLSWNVPTIIFWNPEHWELNSDAMPYFNMLKNVGIFHESPNEAAEHMAKVWNDVNAWWLSETVQDARRRFCDRFSNTTEDCLKLIKEALNEAR